MSASFTDLDLRVLIAWYCIYWVTLLVHSALSTFSARQDLFANIESKSNKISCRQVTSSIPTKAGVGLSCSRCRWVVGVWGGVVGSRSVLGFFQI